MTPDDWLTLVRALSRADLARYDGVIVTHGSDTLAYTAAALSFCFAHSPRPIVLTAANYPLEDPRSNGLRNFANAVELIAREPLPGVFVVYENARGESVVYLGSRLHQAQPFTDEFAGAYDVPFGRIIDGALVRNDHPLNPTIAQLTVPRPRRFEPERIRFAANVLYIKPYPGLDYRFFDLTRMRPCAVLHDLYHSGTACAGEAEAHSLKRFIRDCAAHGVKVYLAPLKQRAGEQYASAVELLAAGAIPIAGTTVEAATVKLMLAYGMGEDEQAVAALLDESLFFERHEEGERQERQA
jgi:L-asparaginase